MSRFNRVPISDLTRKIINSGEGHKLYQDEFKFEGKTYKVIKGRASIQKHLKEKLEEED